MTWGWKRHSVRVTLTFDVLVEAFTQEEAERYARDACELVEVQMGYGNGEQPKLDGGIEARIGA